MDKQPISDERAMELITKALSGVEWSADTLDFIAAVVLANGRTIKDSAEYDNE